MRSRLNQLFGWALLLTTFYFCKNYWRSIWWDKWFLLTLSATALWCVKLAQRFDFVVGLFSMVLLSSALWAFGWRPAYEMMDLDTQLAVKEIAAYSYLTLVMLTLVMYTATDNFYKTILKFIPWICGLNAVYIVVQWLCHVTPQARGGFFGNPSMSGCLLAFGLPLTLYREPESTENENALTAAIALGVGLVVVAAIYLTGASQPVGVFLAVLISWWVCEARPKAKEVVAGVLLIGLLGLAGLTMSTYRPNEGIFDSSGRFAVWRQGLKWWMLDDHKLGSFTLPTHHWIGQGTGLTQVLLPLIQRDQIGTVYAGQHLDWWMWFHSDFVQLLFENGYIGVAAGLLFLVCALRISWRKSARLFAATVGVSATALFNFPVHFPMHAFFAVFILGMVFDKKYLHPKP